MPHESVQFRYGPLRRVVLVVLFFLAGGAFFGVIGANPTGHEYEDVLLFEKIPAQQAHMVWGGMSAVCLVMAVLHFRRSRIKCEVSLTEHAFVAPKSNYWPRREVSVPYHAVQGVRLWRWCGVRHLIVSFNGGKLSIQDSWLPSRTELDTILRLLRERVHCEVPTG
jgi:hypothetical protein